MLKFLIYTLYRRNPSVSNQECYVDNMLKLMACIPFIELTFDIKYYASIHTKPNLLENVLRYSSETLRKLEIFCQTSKIIKLINSYCSELEDLSISVPNKSQPVNNKTFVINLTNLEKLINLKIDEIDEDGLVTGLYLKSNALQSLTLKNCTNLNEISCDGGEYKLSIVDNKLNDKKLEKIVEMLHMKSIILKMEIKDKADVECGKNYKDDKTYQAYRVYKVKKYAEHVALHKNSKLPTLEMKDEADGKSDKAYKVMKYSEYLAQKVSTDTTIKNSYNIYRSHKAKKYEKYIKQQVLTTTISNKSDRSYNAYKTKKYTKYLTQHVSINGITDKSYNACKAKKYKKYVKQQVPKTAITKHVQTESILSMFRKLYSLLRGKSRKLDLTNKIIKKEKLSYYKGVLEKSSSYLKILNLSNCCLIEVDIEILAKLLNNENGVYLKELKELILEKNTITSTGAKKIAAALKRNTSLIKLSLANSTIANTEGIGSEGARELAEMLKQNSTLQELNLHNCFRPLKFDMEATLTFTKVLCGYNRTLETIYLSENFINPYIVENFINLIGRDDGIRKLKYATIPLDSIPGYYPTLCKNLNKNRNKEDILKSLEPKLEPVPFEYNPTDANNIS